MATKTSVVMQTTDQAQKKSSRSITYIDPNASNADIKDFIEGMNDLTTQTLTAANRVDTTDILNATAKLPRNMYLTASGEETPITSIAASTIGTDPSDPLILDLHYAGQLGAADLISLTQSGKSNYWYTWSDRIGDTAEDVGALYICKVTSTNKAATVKITIGEDEQYQAAELTLTITA